jgi:hypothetical protein
VEIIHLPSVVAYCTLVYKVKWVILIREMRVPKCLYFSVGFPQTLHNNLSNYVILDI